MSKPFRIAYLEATSEMGGAEYVLLALLERFPPSVIEPFLICPSAGELTNRAARAQIATLIVSIPPLASISVVWRRRKILNPLAVLYDAAIVLLASVRAARALKRARIELIHTNTLFAHLYGGLAARWLGLPCIWHVHDVIETRRLGGLAGWLWRQLGKALATQIVGSSQCAVRVFAGTGKESTIYVGIEPPATQATGVSWHTQLGLNVDTQLVGYVRRIGWSKGLDLLLEAAPDIIAQNPRTHFIIFGAPPFGETAYAEQIQAQVRRLELTAYWHTVGYVPNAMQCLGDLDCVVLPSRRESFPRVILEAGLASKAVVATNVGGVSEIVESGVTGVLVPPEDTAALAAAVASLLNDRAQRERLGAALQQRVRADFDILCSTQHFIELYRNTLYASAHPVRSQSPDELRPH